MALRAGQADVEQTPLLRQAIPLRTPARQLAFLDPRQVHRLELEPLRPVQRQQVHAATRARPEALADRHGELGRAPVELLREPDESGEVGLSRLLPLPEL